MSLILMGALVLFGSAMLKRRGEEPTERVGLLKRLRSFLSFRVIEDGKEPPVRAPRPKDRAPGESNAMDKIYDTPPPRPGVGNSYGIELNSDLSEDQRAEEIIGLQELWDSSKHDAEKEEKGS
jgi:hypothetical protein